MSKPHAVISYESGKIFISDCGSSNGTFINNFRIGSTNKKSKSHVSASRQEQIVDKKTSTQVDKKKSISKTFECGLRSMGC